MIIGYINRTWSMPRRLALIAAIFLIPSLVQLGIYTSSKIDDIAVLNREIAGANLARAVWDGMTSDDPRTVSAGTDLDELASTSGREFGVQGKIRAFLGAKSPAARAAIAEDLLDEIADASGITLDQSVDTNHMQSILVQHLPRVKLAVAQLQDALNAPASLTEEGQLAIN
jgi:methyl-accepting chemotaxis protein